MDLESLKNFLLDTRLITRADWDLVVDLADGDYQEVKNILVSRGYLTDDEWRRAEAFLLGLPFVDLKRENILTNVLSLIPEPLARQYNIVAYQKRGDALEVAMLDLADLSQIDFLTDEYKILPRLTSSESIHLALKQYQRNLKVTFGDRLKKVLTDLNSEPNEQVVGQLMDLLVEQALSQGASAIHFDPTDRKEVLVRYRLAGRLYEAMVLPVKVLNFLLDKFQDLNNFQFERSGQIINCRLSILPTDCGRRLLLRLWPRPSFGPALEDFGLAPELVEKIYETLYRREGLIIFTGEKTTDKTFLLALLDILNQLDRQIFFIGSLHHPSWRGVTRVTPSADSSRGYAKTFRQVLLQDPDVVVLDRELDDDLAQLSLSGALAGKLILAPLATDKPEEVVDQLVRLGLERKVLESTLKLIIN